MLHFSSSELRATSAGLDYVRLTSKDKQRKGMLRQFFLEVAKRDQQLGYDIKRGGALGFLGDVIRHALYGEKQEWGMLQVSGYEARSASRLAVSEIQATRIDIQVTYQVSGTNVQDVLDRAYAGACSNVRSKSRPVAVTRIENRYQTETVYIGKRSSDIFVRCYDKFRESGKEEYRDCVRFEVELKGRMAKAVWKHMAETGDGVRWLLNMLLEMLRERGIDLPDDDIGKCVAIQPRAEPTTLENTISWLARQVAPTVTKLSGSHGWIMLFSVLFSEALTDEDRKRIMSLLGRVWGN